MERAVLVIARVIVEPHGKDPEHREHETDGANVLEGDGRIALLARAFIFFWPTNCHVLDLEWLLGRIACHGT